MTAFLTEVTAPFRSPRIHPRSLSGPRAVLSPHICLPRLPWAVHLAAEDADGLEAWGRAPGQVYHKTHLYGGRMAGTTGARGCPMGRKITEVRRHHLHAT